MLLHDPSAALESGRSMQKSQLQLSLVSKRQKDKQHQCSIAHAV